MRTNLFWLATILAFMKPAHAMRYNEGDRESQNVTIRDEEDAKSMPFYKRVKGFSNEEIKTACQQMIADNGKSGSFTQGTQKALDWLTLNHEALTRTWRLADAMTDPRESYDLPYCQWKFPPNEKGVVELNLEKLCVCPDARGGCEQAWEPVKKMRKRCDNLRALAKARGEYKKLKPAYHY